MKNYHTALYNPPYQTPEILYSIKNKTLKDSFYLGQYYSDLKKGLYRIKIMAFVNHYVKKIQNKSTPWFYFELFNDIKPYLFRNLK